MATSLSSQPRSSSDAEEAIRVRVRRQKLQQLDAERRGRVSSLLAEQSRIREEIARLTRSLMAGDYGARGGAGSAACGSAPAPRASARSEDTRLNSSH